METSAFFCYFLLAFVVTTKGFVCSGPNAVCLEPRCIQTTADILRVMDLGADPCHDFYQYACGNYAEVTEIPEGQTRWNPFKQRAKQNQKLVQKLLEQEGYDYKGVRSKALMKTKNYFDICLNLTISEKAGIGPLRELIEACGGWEMPGTAASSRRQNVSLCHRLAEIYKLNIQALFGMYLGPDDKNSSLNILGFQQYGLTLGRPESYEESGSSKIRIDALIELGTTIMTLLSDPTDVTERERVKKEARSRIAASLEFEKAMSKVFVPSSKLYDDQSLYNKMPLQRLVNMLPNFDLPGYLERIFGREIDGSLEVVVYTPSYFKKLNRLLRNIPKRVIEDYSMFYMIRRFLAFLPKPFKDSLLEHRNVTSGITEIPLSIDRCMREIDRNFGFVTGALFVQGKASEVAKRKTLEMLGYIREAFLKNLPRISWMDKKAREITEDKARAMTEQIGFPDWILDPEKLDEHYEDLVVTRESRIQNIISYRRFESRKYISQLGAPVDKERWSLGPSQVNAVYATSRNEMMFPSGILQPPFFSNDQPMSMGFGAIGMVMGHELTHGFDNDGRKYDKFGHLNNWLWANEAYEERAECLVKQYSNYTIEGENLDGRITLDENIADAGGVKIAYLAYQNWRRDNTENLTLPLNLTPPQEFFVGFGQSWCSYYTPEAAKLFLVRDSHANEKYRIIGSLSNLPAFSEAFECPAGSPMNPVEKCEVW